MSVTSGAGMAAEDARHAGGIIGAGFGGYGFFAEGLALTLEDNIAGAVRYVLVDPRPADEFGRGVAWTHNQPEVLRMNMHTSPLLIDRNENEKVVREIIESEQNQASLGKLFKARRSVGEMFHNSLENYLSIGAEAGVDCQLLINEAVEIQVSGIGYRINFKDRSSVVAHTIVLALGHFPRLKYKEFSEFENYYSKPWDFGLLKKVDREKRVGVLGLGPTAVDSILICLFYTSDAADE